MWNILQWIYLQWAQLSETSFNPMQSGVAYLKHQKTSIGFLLSRGRDKQQSKIGLCCHSLNLLIYRGISEFWKTIEGEAQNFPLKMEVSSYKAFVSRRWGEGGKHWFSLALVINGFCSNNTPNSASLLLIKFVFLLTPLDQKRVCTTKNTY